MAAPAYLDFLHFSMRIQGNPGFSDGGDGLETEFP
jgi:hypothetical protein